MKRAPARPKHALQRRAALAAALAPWLAPQGAAAALASGERVEWPTLELLDGRRLAPSHWQDRAAVVVVFSTTCPFCARHNAHVQKLHAAAQGRPLTVLGAALDTDPAVVRAYLQARGYGFPVTLQGAALRARFTARQVIPYTLVVDRQGRLRDQIPGEMFEEDVMELLRHAA